MPRYLTEAEAWRWIAERIERGEWDWYGICNEIIELRYPDPGQSAQIDSNTKDVMQSRLRYHMEPVQFFLNSGLSEEEDPWAFPEGVADVRILAAYFLALDAEDHPNG